MLGLPAAAQTDEARWIDSVMNKLTVDQKIGQLFFRVIPARANAEQVDKVLADVKSLGLGGVVFQQENPHHQVAVARQLQAVANVPLLVAQQGAWDLNRTVDSLLALPAPSLLGAVGDDSLVHAVGRESARQMQVLGVNFGFIALSETVATLRDGIVRPGSLGTDPSVVARKVAAFAAGMQEQGLLTCARPFEVTSLTITDFVNDLPRVRATVDSLAMSPYELLLANGVAGVMAASASVPVYYDGVKARKNSYDAATLAHVFTGPWLKQQRAYQGLVLIDLQTVKVVADKSKDGDEAVFAFQAGNDVLMGSGDIGASIRRIKRLIKAETGYEAQLNSSARRILQAKFRAGLSRRPSVNPDNLMLRLQAASSRVITERLYEKAVTVIRNDAKAIPLVQLDNREIAYVTAEAGGHEDTFGNCLRLYARTTSFILNEKTDLIQLADALSRHQVAVLGVFPKTTSAVLGRIERLVSLVKPSVELIFCDFGNEAFLRTAGRYRTTITGYDAGDQAMVATAEVLFGATPASGQLPFSVSRDLPAGAGVSTTAVRRLGYSTPERAGMDSRMLLRIDSIAHEAIKTGATPGMQVIVARGGSVVYEKNFGTLNHNPDNPVTAQTIYDLASLTKVSATLQAVMFMYEKGLIDLNRKVSYYLPELKGTNKKDITIIEMLTHQAGLAPFIPMWPETVKDTTFLPHYYSRTRSTAYPLQVSPNLFGSMALRDSVWSWVVSSKLIDKQARTPFVYRYSDLGFLILQRLAERLLNQPLDEFVAQNLYEPLGAYNAGFLPLDRFASRQIAPTEYDRIFRRTLVTGTVHDERGALMGGVAGHAGLFGTAADLAKLGQMLLQEGYYGGYRYYRPETVRMFTNKQFDRSRRGLGWDKPVQSDWNSPTSLKASPRTFGHTGFTGTCLWVDPEFDLVYVFLSNRVYPDRSGKLISANIRSRIQDVIYDAIFTYCDRYPAVPLPVEKPFLSSRR